MSKVLGIVTYDENLPERIEMLQYRSIAALSFAGRYRVIDFVLSNMVNSGIEQINVLVKYKPRSIVEHVGTGRQYNINSKRGKFNIMFGDEDDTTSVYSTDVRNFISNKKYLISGNPDYVVIAPSYMISSINYQDVVDAHIASGADVTAVYKAVDDANVNFGGCNHLTMNPETKRVTWIEKNIGKYKTRNISMETYVLKYELFLRLIDEAQAASPLYTFKDILIDRVDDYNIKGYAYRGYLTCVNTFRSYYQANVDMANVAIASKLLRKDWPIYTKTNDSEPTLYSADAKVINSGISNGCMINGTVENSIIGRDVVIGKGAVVRNSVILADTVVGEGVVIDTAVVDKHCVVKKVKELVGTPERPVYIKRFDKI